MDEFDIKGFFVIIVDKLKKKIVVEHYNYYKKALYIKFIHLLILQNF